MHAKTTIQCRWLAVDDLPHRFAARKYPSVTISTSVNSCLLIICNFRKILIRLNLDAYVMYYEDN